jgi:NAD(P)H dehydrogenase (quinone)
MNTWMVTGATGHVGSAALRSLAAAHPGQRLAGLVRDVGRACGRLPASVELRTADYDDASALITAMNGVDRLLWIASDGAGPDVLRHHANVLGAAVAAGVGHIVFTSIIDIDPVSAFYFTPVYREAERALAHSGCHCTVLRCGLYADFLLEQWLEPALAAGLLTVPAGEAAVAPVCRDDVAQAAAAALSAPRPPGGVLQLTGTRSWTFAQIAQAASDVHQTPVRYVPMAPAEYLLQCWARLRDPWPHAFSSLFASIRQGRYAAVSADSHVVLARPATPLDDFLRARANRTSAAWPRRAARD